MNKVGLASLAAIGLIALTGCSGGTQASSASTSAVTVAPPAIPSPTATPTPTATATPTRQLSARGNVIKKVGDVAWASVSQSDSSVIFKIVVTKIEVDPTCTNPGAESPANGHFVSLTLNVEAEPALAKVQSALTVGNPSDWKIFDPNGMTQNSITSGPSYGCFPQSEILPTTMSPGEKATGRVVFDTSATSGDAMFGASLGGNGWEWAFPASSPSA